MLIINHTKTINVYEAAYHTGVVAKASLIKLREIKKVLTSELQASPYSGDK